MANNEFGDFQTNERLAASVVALLGDASGNPATIVEPTCGRGNFIAAAHAAYPNSLIHGLEINPDHVQGLEKRFQFNSRVVLHKENYFDFDWESLVAQMAKPVWVIGNPPWVTNTQLIKINSANLPVKSPQAHLRGIEAQTGKSNFDISESMMRDWFGWCESCDGSLAVICKTSVARKLLMWWWKAGKRAPLARMYLIDAKAEFDVSVSACVLVCSFGTGTGEQQCTIFSSLDAVAPESEFGLSNGVLVSDARRFCHTRYLLGKSNPQWRSGIKHDAGKVLELRRRGVALVNGYGDQVEVESDFLFPLLKGSDLSKSEINREVRGIIVPQSFIGEDVRRISQIAPQTWSYLMQHGEAFDGRKSVIYKKGQRFSIFGVGEYSFQPWKIAIAALYKSLEFRLIGPIGGKPVMFDDTVYFLGFPTKDEAEMVLARLQSQDAQTFLRSMIFWDDMRPVKTEILNRLDLSVAPLKRVA